jgi:NAD(P)-dependent dehydrogenase (short-subunit alcohol dehydrogenase family)
MLFSVDLTDYDNVQQIVTQITGKLGRVSGLINSAGISTTLPFIWGNPKRWMSFFHANVHSAFNLTRMIVRPEIVAEKGASIVFISSVMAVVGENGKSLYSMTKGALIAGARSRLLNWLHGVSG